MSKTPRTLGKGLSALLGDTVDILQDKKNSVTSTTLEIDINLIKVNVDQPRKYFDEAALADLTNSIKEKGVIQPIIINKISNSNQYQIIAGERRWRASKMAGLTRIPVVVKSIDNQELLELSIIENIQRENLNVIEEAEGYRKLMDDFSYTQEKLSKKIGKSRSYIANMLRVLSLPQEIREYVHQGKLSMSHARSLIGVAGNVELARDIISNNISVKELDNRLKISRKTKKSISTTENNSASNKSKNILKSKDQDLIIIENNISDRLGMKVAIDEIDEGGIVKIVFNDLEQLDQIIKKLSDN